MRQDGAWENGETQYEQIVRTRFGRYLSGLERKAIDKALQAGRGKGIAADIGSDGGRWSRYLFEKGYSVVCTDIDEESLSLCQQRLPDCLCTLTSEQAVGLPFQSARIDMLLCIGVVEVVLADWFAEESFRILRPDGVLVASVPNQASWRAVLARIIPSQRRWAPNYALSYSSFKDRMREQGFSFIQEIGCRWIPLRRNSNSRAVCPLAWFEKYAGFSRLTKFSPWIIVVASKR